MWEKIEVKIEGEEILADVRASSIIAGMGRLASTGRIGERTNRREKKELHD